MKHVSNIELLCLISPYDSVNQSLDIIFKIVVIRTEIMLGITFKLL